MEFKKETYSYLNLIITSVLMQDYLEQLKTTTAYKQQLKYHAKGLSDEVEKILDKELSRIWSMDEQMTVNLMRNFESLVNEISVLTPDELLALNHLVKAFKADKAGFIKNNHIMLVEIDNLGKEKLRGSFNSKGYSITTTEGILIKDVKFTAEQSFNYSMAKIKGMCEDEGKKLAKDMDALFICAAHYD